MQNVKGLITAGLMIAALFVSAASSASRYESINHLNTLAVEFIDSHVALNPDEKSEVHLSKAAYDLRLTACATPISISIPAESAGQKINTLEMTCSSQPSWHVYVPVDMRILTKVVVARETIPSKTVITEDMLDIAYRDKNALFAGYFKDVKEIINQVPVSTVVAGTVMTRRNIQQPVIINRNQVVSIISKHGHIMVSAEGIAKSDGALNEVIKVINTSSKRTIDAMVTSGSTVEVGA